MTSNDTANHTAFGDRRPLLLGTRRSKLAVAQAGWVADRVTTATGRPVRLVTLSTEGDETTAPIERIGSTGVFVTALRRALLAREVDFVVHSYKDLPTAPEPDLRVAAVPEREDPRDALAGPAGLPGSLPELRAGARIGTGSPRRAAQLRAYAPHLDIVPMRGNVDSRLRKTMDGELDAVVLAMAGLSRLGRLGDVAAPLPPDVLLPAPSQGALAVECRADDTDTVALLGTVDDPRSHRAVAAERAFLTELAAGCTSPVAALAEHTGAGTLRLEGLIAAPDGSAVVRRAVSGSAADPVEMGRGLARTLLADGGADLLALPAQAAADPHGDPRRRPVHVSQPLGQR
ncbi:hydroxymethylbilane synthase [Actinomadura spongiicola]|uniref:Porphobilinogen deaminase n=1 Tax=Actinomadura spongiicola TaxID=2303421 RepID=A0A372GCX1_9ACTN|nr:hydroxymethylbilane synthase [Actinomadura spongiicola]RFS83022.1 hydroxymethylbilane synthase [Actinomadura spongiicola]